MIIKISEKASESMNNNFLYFRNIANIPKKTLARLLNTSVYTYCGYENNRLTVPEDVLIMFSKIFQITIEEIFMDPSLISKETHIKLKHLSILKGEEKEYKLISGLIGTDHHSISYKEIATIRKNIYNNLKNNGATQ